MAIMMREILVLGAGLCAMALVVGGAQAAGDAAAGAGKASMCAGCHGAQGEGKEKNPALAGKDTAFISKQLQDFRSGTRQDPMKMMNMLAKPLSDQDIANLAAYYASLKGK
jgi:cytochrome c553